MVAARPMRRCTSPGCPRPVESGRCEQHDRLAGRQRDTWTHLYGRDWPRRRLEYLAGNPRCALCPALANVADHHPKGIRLLRKIGVSDPHDDKRLRPLCARCHNEQTAQHQPGGWNRRQS